MYIHSNVPCCCLLGQLAAHLWCRQLCWVNLYFYCPICVSECLIMWLVTSLSPANFMSLYNGEWTVYRAFPLSLSGFALFFSASLAHRVKAGVYRNSRQAGPSHTAEQHRNVLYALESQDRWNKIVRQVPWPGPAGVRKHYIYSPVNSWSKKSIAVRCRWRNG